MLQNTTAALKILNVMLHVKTRLCHRNKLLNYDICGENNVTLAFKFMFMPYQSKVMLSEEDVHVLLNLCKITKLRKQNIKVEI